MSALAVALPDEPPVLAAGDEVAPGYPGLYGDPAE